MLLKAILTVLILCAASFASWSQIVRPFITQQPESVKAIAGDHVSFRVAVEGTAPLFYQWQFNGVTLTGATNDVLALANVQPATSGEYRVIVSNAAGSVTSEPARLTVTIPVRIRQQPQGQTVIAGGTARLSVAAEGSEPISYQWFFFGYPLGDATNDTLILTSVQPINQGAYIVEVRNPAGFEASAEAELIVHKPVMIFSDPKSQSRIAGEDLHLSVVALGTEPLTYQWQRNGMSLPGETNDVLLVTNIQPAEAGLYSALVGNILGVVQSQPAQVVVLEPVSFLQQPQHQTAIAGSTITLKASATGSAPLFYQWWRYYGFPIAGATNDTLVLSNVQPKDAGGYHLVISNPVDSFSSELAAVEVLVPITIQQQPASQTVLTQDSVFFYVRASGTQPLTYRWRLDGAPLIGATNDFLILTNLQTIHGGIYTVSVSNILGGVTSAETRLDVLEPARITRQPQNLARLPGDSAVLEVSAAGTEPITYQWFFGSILLPDATNATLMLTNLQRLNGGPYFVEISNPAGSIFSDAGFLEVNVPVQIIRQPQSQKSVLFEGAYFDVHAEGTEPLTYQWQFNGLDLVGETNSFLGLSDLKPAQAGSYTVVVSNLISRERSAESKLAVLEPPQIIRGPFSRTLLAGESAMFEAVASGTEPLLYQWFRNRYPIPAATNATLSILRVGPHDEGIYSIRVRNELNELLSLGAVVEVNLPVQIVQSPQSQTAIQGDSAFFEVNAQGSEPLAFQWRFNGADLPGETNAFLFLDNVQSTHGGNYSVRVDNLVGSVVSVDALLTVRAPLLILAAPKSQLVTAGDDAVFNVVTVFDENLSYQWHFNGLPITGATRDQLILTNVQPEQAGTYFVGVNASSGSEKSAEALLFVNQPIRFTRQPQSQTVLAGSTAQMTAGATGSEPLFYQWFAFGSAIPGETNSTLTLANVQPEHEGGYQVVVSNPLTAETSDQAQIVVHEPITILRQPQDTSVIAGRDVFLGIKARGTFPLQFQWHFNGVALPGATNDFLELTNVQASLAGSYKIMVNNPVGSLESAPAQVTVLDPVIIGQHPQSRSVLAGEAVVLSVAARGTAPLAYQWFLDGLALPKATNSSLVLSDIRPFHSGSYGVSVSNPVGAEFSQSAELTVNLPAAIIQAPESQTVMAGDGVYFEVRGIGSEPLSYQWQLNGINLSAETNAYLWLPAAQPPNAGTYSVVVNNPVNSDRASALLTVELPPVISQEPASQVVLAASQGLFRVSATGTPPLKYQWHFYGFPLPGETNSELVLRNVQTVNGGPYFVEIVNPAGEQFSQVAELRVQVPIRIVRQPLSDTTVQGSDAYFEVSAFGSEPLEYQWERNGAALSGETNYFLILTNLQPAHAGNYAVAISNEVGLVRSAEARLSVLTPPIVARQPIDQTVSAGAGVTFSVAAGGSEPLFYQWRFNGGNIPGATNATFTLANAQSIHSGSYAVAIANLAAAVNSLDAELIVDIPQLNFTDQFRDRMLNDLANGSGRGTNDFATKERSEPDHAGKPGGASVWFLWRAPDSGIATFNTRGSSFDTLLAVYTGASVSNLVWVASDDDRGGFFASQVAFNAVAGAEYPIAIDGVGGQTGNIVLNWFLVKTDEEIPRILQPPRNQTAPLRTNVTLSVIAESRSALQFQWFFNEEPLPGATNAIWIVDNLQSRKTGRYHVRVSNQSRFAISPPATVEIGSQLQAISEDKFQDLFAETEDRLQPQALYAWRKSSVAAAAAGVLGTQILNNFGATKELAEPNHANTIGGASRWFRLRAQDAGILVIDTIGSDIDTVLAVYTGTSLLNLNLVTADNNSAPDGLRSLVRIAAIPGTEYLVAIDGVSGTQGKVQLNWRYTGLPGISQAPMSQIARLADAVTFSVLAAGDSPLHFQWRFNEVPIVGATNGDYTIKNAQLSHAGQYSVMVSNLAGIATSASAGLTIAVPPTLTAPPQRQLASAGSTVTFTVVAAGTAPLAYQWRFNGFDLLGATNSTLVLNNLQPVDAGAYSVVVSNRAGSVTSPPATLTVNPAPTIVSAPQDQIVVPGASVTLSVVALGAPPLSYQWRFNGVNIPEATRPSLIIPSVEVPDAGVYTVLVSNPNGSVVSTPALLTISSQLPFRLANAEKLANGSFRLRLIGLTQPGYVIQASSTLSAWSSIFTNTVPDQFEFIDPAAANLPLRFYRALPHP